MRDDIQLLFERVESALDSDEPQALGRALDGAHAANIAEIFELLDDEQRSRILYALPARITAEVIALLDEAELSEVVERIDDSRMGEIISALPPDDAADVLGEMTEEHREEVLGHVGPTRSEQVERLLEYDEQSAGGIMTPELLALPADATVAQAVQQVRDSDPDEDLHNVFVVDRERKLLGLVPLRRLVTNPQDIRLGSICDRDPVSVTVNEDQEDAMRLMRKYDVFALPVVDELGRLVGRITHDDVMDIAEEEAAEDLYHMAGTDAAELHTTSSVRAAGIRLRWLLPCLAGTTVTATVMVMFREGSGLTAAQIVSFLFFVPMIGAMAGNCGIQTSTIIVAGLASGDLAAKRVSVVMSRELRIACVVAAVCGVFAGLVAGAGIVVADPAGSLQTPATVSAIRVGMAVGSGMIFAMVVAAGLGITLPFTFQRIGVDPAIASGPLVTTFNDSISVSIYLTIAVFAAA